MDWTLVIFTVVSAIVYGSVFFIKAYMTTDPKPVTQDHEKCGYGYISAVLPTPV